jgi:hypothetical protein
VTDLDLFGDPAAPPRKNQPGYLEYLAQLDYGPGWTFWALAATGFRLPRGLAMADHDAVWLIDSAGQVHTRVIEIATGKIILTVEGSV